MDLIKKRILFSDLDDGFVKFKINLNQKYDVLGLMTDLNFGEYVITTDTRSYPVENNNSIQSNTLLFGSYSTEELAENFIQGGKIDALTDSKSHMVKSYSANEPYKIGLDIDKSTYKNYNGDTVDGVTRVTNVNGDELTYVVEGNNDSFLGTDEQNDGLLFIDNPIDGFNSNNAEINENMSTKVRYLGNGWNNANSSMSAQIQEEYLIGIINPPEVNNEIFIERGATNILERHLRLSEIETLDHLERYGNGYYNINRD